MNNQDKDGAYYALKGYLFQFDKSLIEIYDNQQTQIQIEQIQDIGHDPYYIQVKHKEAKTYSHSKIKSAVIQLLKEFQTNPDKQFILYCHFADKDESQWQLSEQDLNEILGGKSSDFTTSTIKAFLPNFLVTFAPNFESQFNVLVEKIQTTYSLKDKNHALIYHSIFRAHLMKVAINKTRLKRIISKTDLDALLESTEKVVLSAGYLKYLGEKNYNALIKNYYFTPKSINKDSLNRVFILDSALSDNQVDEIKIITKIIERFYKVNKSSVPFICIRNSIDVNKIKQRLIDVEIHLFDGTYFDGDKYRVEDLVKKQKPGITIRFIKESELQVISTKIDIDEIYEFFVSTPMKITISNANIYQIHVKSMKQALNIIS